jgi:AcrR family transcriptional regulator
MAPPPAATDKGEMTRQRVLEVAGRHFMERGYKGTSLNDLIKESGLTKGGFYFHFASKAELALATLDMIRESYRTQVFSQAGRHVRAVEQIAAMVRAIADEKYHEAMSSALGRLCQELSAVPGVDAERLRPYEAWFVLVADLFRRAQSQGDMNPSVDADAAAHFAVTAYLGLDAVADVHGDPAYPANHVENYLTFIFTAVGMRVPVPPREPLMGGQWVPSAPTD